MLKGRGGTRRRLNKIDAEIPKAVVSESNLQFKGVPFHEENFQISLVLKMVEI